VNWKKLSIIVVVSLVTIIVVIPAAVVTPFINSEPVENYQTKEQQIEESAKEEIEEEEYVVSVFRSQQQKVDDIPLEKYVAGVVASEMPADFELEALKAQALAARTYVVKHILYGEEVPQGGQITDTVQHQVYNSEEELKKIWGADFTWKMEKINQAVAETKGEILTYEGELIEPAFFSTSNGYTENAEDYWSNALPYLKSVPSPWDVESPKFQEQAYFTVQELEEKLGVDFSKADNDIANITRTKSDRVKSITIAGKEFSGREVREALGLRSSDFTIQRKGDHFIFKTEGYGHGVGMSQYGANGMAKEGKTYKEILTYYYQGVEIIDMGSEPDRFLALKREV
jgi:stage II sporulation protein D